MFDTLAQVGLRRKNRSLMRMPKMGAAALIIPIIVLTACQIGIVWPSEATEELTIIIQPDGNGSVEIDGSVAGPGEVIPNGKLIFLTANPSDEDWRFDRWELDLTGSSNHEALVMDGSKRVRAVFEPKPSPPPTDSLSGVGTASINGVFAPGEWDEAGRADFDVNLIGGGSTPATVYVMNDWTNLYLAVKIIHPDNNNGVQISFAFNNDNLGMSLANGDDQIKLGESLGFLDEVRRTGTSCSAGNDQDSCGFGDALFGGTTEGAGAILDGTEHIVFEMYHPLNSLDSANDFSLVPGNSVGFILTITFGGQVTTFGPTDLAPFGGIKIAFPEEQ